MKIKHFIIAISVITLFINCTKKEVDSEVAPVKANIISYDSNWTEKIQKSDAQWKNELDYFQYFVLREKGTEQPYSHSYYDTKQKGIYLCSGCFNPLFSSDTKFESGTGWPSFYIPYSSKSVVVGLDDSHGMTRDEVVCAKCDGHLGHVFDDGPPPTGLRYCLNGVSLILAADQSLEKVVFAQGCFWCVEEIFEAIKGVSSVVSGYSGGEEKNPTYAQVSAGETGHAEAVEISYDPNVISYNDLLRVYFNSGDITQVNGQGNDLGKQYRSVVFYNNETQKQEVETYIANLNESGEFTEPIAVEIAKLEKFWVAEEYHQDYVKLNPNDAYVIAVSVPRYQESIMKFPELLK